MEGMVVEDTSGENILKTLINEKCVDVSKDNCEKLYKEILSPGEEGDDKRPTEGCEVQVHYVGTLPDGTEFDRSDARGKPFSFVLGEGQVIKGWEQGVATMQKGERCKLYIHPEFGYGAKECGQIPPNSTLIFEVELISFKPEDLTNSKSGGLLRQKLVTGKTKYLNPNEGSVVKVKLEGKYDGKVFDEREVEFVLGEGSEANIPYGVEKALFKFCDGEKSLLTIGPKYGFGSAGSKEYNIPPDATVHYVVELVNFERNREAWQMDPMEKIEASKKAKEKGTNFFKEEKYFLAARQYKSIVAYLKTEAMLEGEQEELRKSLLLAAYLNQALCHLKLNEPVVAKRHADDAIELDANNAKAFYRRGLANIGIKEAEDAKQDFLKVLELEPDNKAARQQLTVCDKLIRQHKEREKQVYSRMFEKFAKLDTAKEQAELKKQPNGLDNLDEWAKNGNDKMDIEDAVTVISGPDGVKT